MKPSAMLYRNLLAIEVEEMIRANPLDGLVLLANCDKSVPGALMGAISANVPTVLVTGGSRPVVGFRGQPVGTGTALWRMWDERRAGRLDDDGLGRLGEMPELRARAPATRWAPPPRWRCCPRYSGFMVPGAASIPAGDERRPRTAAREAGRARGPRGARTTGGRSEFLTEDAFSNAIVALNAVGGSTNAVIHLAALAGRAGVPFSLDDIARLGARVPVLADVEPSGRFLMRDFDAAGGVPTLLRELAGLLRPRRPHRLRPEHRRRSSRGAPAGGEPARSARPPSRCARAARSASCAARSRPTAR